MVEFEVQVFHLRNVTITRKKEDKVNEFCKSLFEIRGTSEGFVIT